MITPLPTQSFRIVFMGTPDFAVPPFEALCEAGHQVLLALTQPDRPAGRGLHPVPPPVKQAALRRGVPVLQPESMRTAEILTTLQNLTPDFLVVAAYGEILPKRVLDVPVLAPLNVHASLLPRHRGASPIHQAVIQGDAQTGITIMRMTSRLDAGDIFLQCEAPIGPRDTAGSLHDRLAGLGAAALLQALDRFARHEAVFTPQNEALATYAPMLDRPAARIDWNCDAVTLDRRVRGLNPWPVAFTAFRGEPLKVWEAMPAEGVPDESFAPGTLRLRGNTLEAACGGGTALTLLRLQLPGRKVVGGAEFARGAHLVAGERFA